MGATDFPCKRDKDVEMDATGLKKINNTFIWGTTQIRPINEYKIKIRQDEQSRNEDS